MKKTIVLGISIPLLAVLIALGVSSVLKPKASFGDEYTVNGTVLTKYNGTEENVTIPAGITEIGAEAFSGNPLLSSVAIPDGTTKIGYAAFSNCVHLKNVSIPDSLQTIEDSAFNGDSALETINIGTSLHSLGSGVFGNCVSLADVTISDKNQNFISEKGGIYSKNQNVLYMYLPGYPGKQYKMPDTVTEVKRYAFWGCDYLEDVLLSTGLSKIGDNTFANCNSLETLVAYAPLNQIGSRAFDTCPNFVQITLPPSVTNIHNSAFDYCSKELLFVCNAGSYVDTYALSNGFQTSSSPRYLTEYLEEPVINTTVSENLIEEREESTENPAEEVVQVQTSPAVSTTDGTLLFDGKIVSDRVYVMVDGLAVHDGKQVSSTNTENKNLTTVSDYAYYGNSNLDTLNLNTLGNGIESIGKLSFARSSINQVEIPDGVISIGYGAFYHCDNLETILIPSSVTSVEAYAFDHTPWMNSWLNSEEEDFLIIGDGVLLAYKGNGEDVIIPDGVKYIADQVFRDHKEIQSVTLSNGIISIGSYTFAGCDSLSEIHNGEGNIISQPTSFEGCLTEL